MSVETVRSMKLGWVWGAVAIGVLILAGGVTPWDAILEVISNGGVGEEQASLLGFVAGYTLPLCVGFTIIGVAWITGMGRGANPYVALAGMAFVLIACGWVAQELGLGQLPIPDAAGTGSMHPAARLLVAVLRGYVNQYGMGLALSSLLIAVGLTLTIAKQIVGEAPQVAGSPAGPTD